MLSSDTTARALCAKARDDAKLKSNQQRKKRLALVAITIIASQRLTNMMRLSLLSVVLASVVIAPALGFSTRPFAALTRQTSCSVHVLEATREKVTVEPGFIEQELRGAAMKLHTKSQAPKEGQATETSRVEPHVTTLEDYLQFLVDSQHVYQAMEDIVNQEEQLTMFRNTRLERTEALEKDVEFMCQEYGLTRPEVGVLGKEYAQELRRIAASGNIPEFMCHYYNFYFAHTAGGRMIGKQMAALLLDKKTLEFYKVCNTCFCCCHV